MSTRKFLAGLALVSMLALTACESQSDAPIENAASTPPIFHVDPAAAQSGYPFSEAVEVDGWLFLSGVIGSTASGGSELAPGGMAGQSRAALDIVKATLEKRGYAMTDVVKCTVMIDDMALWSDFNTIYKEYFKPPYPARSAFGADGLALGAAVELECIAKK